MDTQGWKVQIFKTCPSDHYWKNLPVQWAFYLSTWQNSVLLMDVLLGLPRSRFNHPFGFTCPTPFLLGLDRQTVYNFYPRHTKKKNRHWFRNKHSEFYICYSKRGRPEATTHQRLCFFWKSCLANSWKFYTLSVVWRWMVSSSKS